MKKRLISAFVALSMIFSLIPTTFAQQSYDSDGNLTGSPNIVKDLKFEITAGELTQFDITFGNGINNPGTYFAGIVTDYNDEAVGNDYTDTVTDDSVGVGYFTMTETIPYDPDTGECWGLYGPAAQWTGGSSPDSTVNLTWDSATNKSFNWTEGEDGFGSNFALDMGHEAYTSIADLEGCSVYVYILVGNVDNADFSNAFVANVGAFDAEGNLKFPEGGDPTPTPEATAAPTYVGDVTVSVTDPVVGAEPSTSSTTSGDNVDTSATTVVWDTTTTPLTSGGKYDASSIYSATVTLTAADGATFQAGSTVTVNSATAVTLTADMISNDGKTATVTYTAPETDPLKVTSVTATGTLDDSSYAPGDAFSAASLEATITYNNGESESGIDVTNNNYGVFAALATDQQSASSNSHGATLAISDDQKDVYIVYDHAQDTTSSGIDTTAGLVKSLVVDTISVTNATISAINLGVTAPVVGVAADFTATSADNYNPAQYNIESVQWTTDSGSTSLNSGDEFEYGKAYEVIVELSANSGYALPAAGANTVTINGNPATWYGTYATYTFPAVASPTIATTDSYDKYDGGNDVDFTITGTLTSVTGVTVNGTTLNSGDYSVSGTTLTISAAALNAIATATNLDSTGATWTVNVSFDGNGSATGSISAADTTPYITITQPSNATISANPSITVGSRQALVKNQQYVLTVGGKPAHSTATTWTVNGITGTASGDTYTFTPTGGEDISATVTVTVDAGSQLTVNITGNGSVTVAGDDGQSVAQSGNVYTVYSDVVYTLTATPAAQNKFVQWGDGTTATTFTVSNPSANTTVSAEFAAKTTPVVNPQATQIFRKNDTTGDIVYTYSDNVDYGTPTISGVTGTHDSANKTYTITNATLNGLSEGTKTVTFDFGEGMVITRDIEVKPARTISNVVLPTTSFKHGDNFDATGLAFTITTDGNAVTYTYDGTNWSTALPSDVQIKLGNSGSFMAPDAFISTYEAVITRHDTDVSGTVNNGDIITVSAGNVSASSAGISVAQKPITIDAATSTGINKVYNKTAVAATDVAAADFTSLLVSGDDVSVTLDGTYYANASDMIASVTADEVNDKVVKFTADATGNDAGNYIISVNNGSGKITKRPLVITAIKNVPNAVHNKADTATGSSSANIVSGGSDVVLNTANYDIISGDTVAITYDYSYPNISVVGPVSNVAISNIATTDTNYTVSPATLSDQDGEVAQREISSISISDPTTLTYNYSDTFDPTGIQVTVEYAGEATPVVYDWDDVPSTITVKWTGGTDVTGSETLNVPDYNTKTITATDGTHSDATSAITVNKLPVVVTASGTMTKSYDGNTTYTGNGVTYSVALDSSASAYQTVFTTDNVTVSSATASFDDKNAGSRTAQFSGTTLSNSDNYQIANTVNNVTASISKADVSVTAITNIPAIPQYSTGLTGSKTVTTNGSGDVAVTGIQNGESIVVKYDYAYPDSTTSGTRNDVVVTACVLTSDAVNANYNLVDFETPGTGSVTARTINNFTITAPTQFATSQVYGTALDLAGLEVTITYSDNSTDKYTWTASGWTLTPDGGTAASVASVPFKWVWEGGSQPTQSETLTVVDHNNKGITATSTDDPSKSATSSKATVTPLEVSAITITGDNVTKKYDGTTDVNNANFTYALTDTLVGDDALSIAPATVKYVDANVGTGKTLVYTGWALTAGNGTTDTANYKIAATPTIAADAPTGDIEKRPVTLTSISNVPAIAQYDANNEKSSSASSADNAAFEAYDASAQTGIISGETVTVDYKYVYVDPDTATAVNAAAVTLNDVTLDSASDAKYVLTWTGATATGTVTETAISAIEITTLPAQFQSGADVQYGDTLDLSGLEVKVSYGDPVVNTETYVYDGTSWTKNSSAATPPFTLTMDGSTPVNGSALAVSSTSKTLTVETGNGESDTDGSLVVNKRKVNVSPSGTDVTKMYDGSDVYTNAGAITWTVTAVGTFNGTLPTVTSATYTYNSENVTEATHVTATSPVLSDTTNFVVDGYTGTDVLATITTRKIKLTEITNVPAVNQYQTTGISGTGITATSPSQAVFAAADIANGIYDIVSGDTVTITYDYNYTDTATANPVVDNVELSNIVLASSIPSSNYELDVDIPTSMIVPPTVREVDSITVENPTQLQSAVTYKDTLDLAGLEVTINYTDGDPDVYTYDGSVWTKDSQTVVPPFTVNWSNTTGTSYGQGETLTVDKHNGNKIKAEYNGESGEGDAVTVNPKEITAINATLPSGEIAKVYDGNTNLEADDKALIEYTLTGVASGDEDTVAISTTPSYASKDKGDSIAIEFSTPTLANTLNGNYKLADNLEVSSGLTGKITTKEVTITGVYVPLTYVDDSAAADLEINVSNATLAASVTTDTVTATGFVGNEGNAMSFEYTIVYPQASLDTAGTPAVSIKDGAGSVTGTGVGNYTFVWPTGLTGNVLADQFTDVEISQPTKMTGYTHGDVFEPSGMSVTIKTSSDPAGTTYTVTGTNGSYAWNTALPTGVSVAVGGVSLTSNADLNRNAHYLNMDGKNIMVTAGTESAHSADTVDVAQKQLTATASANGTLEKTYDANANLPSGTTVSCTIGTGEVATFGGVTDDVEVTATAAYEDKNAADPKAVKISAIALTGNDAGNYIVPSSIADLSGKINPFTINVTDVLDAIPNAKLNDESTKTGTITSTTNYTNNVTPDGTPAITYVYTYDNVNSIGEHDVTISGVALVTPDSNYTVKSTVPTKTGTVETKAIESITITTEPTKAYKYGENLDLTGMVVEVTYDDGSKESNVAYDTTANSVWTMLGLEIDGTADGTLLKNSAHNGAEIKVKKGSVVSDNAVTLKVDKRKLLLDRDGSVAIEKDYDGTTTVNQTITLKIAADQTGYNGLLAADSDVAVATSPAYVYPSKDYNADPYTLTRTNDATMSGGNAAEYELVYANITGTIAKKAVTVAPVMADIPANKYATADVVVTESNLTAADTTKITVSGLVQDEKDDITFGYTVTVPAADLAAVATKTYAPTATSENGTGVGNYNFKWNNASVEIVANSMVSMVVKTDPADIANQKVYGDSIDPAGMVVEVTYADGTTKDFTYDSTEWNDEGFTVSIEDGGDLTKLVTANDGKHIVVSKTDLDDAKTTGTLKVDKRDLTLTAAANGTITKVYDSTNSVASSQVNVEDTGAYSDDEVTIGTVTATYDDKNADTGKTVTVTVTGTSIKDASGTDVTGEYNIIAPGTLTGDITVKDITIVVTDIPEILSGSTGADLEPEVTSYTYKDGVAPYGSDDVTVKVSAVYAEADAANAGSPTVTFEEDITGDDAANYNFILDPASGTGSVVDNIIEEIAVTGGEDEYVHGDNLDLTDMVITVTYKDPIDNNEYTYNATNNNWTDKNGATVATSDLPVSIALNSTTVTDAKQQLRHDTHDTNKLIVSGGQATPVEVLTLTVAQKEITEITVGYADTYTAADITKTYNGLENVDDEEKFSYTANNIVSFGGVADTVNVTAAAGAATYDTKDVNAVADTKVIEFNDKTKFSVDNNNYKLADNFTINGTVNGNITKADLTINITSVPSLFVGANTEVTLTKDTHYTQTGEQNGETVSVAVKGTYADTATDGTKAVTFTTDPTTLENYNIIVNNNGTTGTVNKKPVTGITVTGPTDTEYEHGDNLDLEGLTITVTYADETKEYTYSNNQWTIGGTPVAAPEDVVIEWGGTTNAVADDTKLRLDDTDKNLTVDGDNKKATLNVTATIYDPASAAPSGSVGVVITKKQLTLEVSGNLTKTYDGTANITADTSGIPLTFTLGGVDNADVSLNETATQDNVKFSQSDAMDPVPPTPPALVIGTVVLDDSNNKAQYYNIPTIAQTSNQTSGVILKKLLKITGINPGPSVETDASATGTMEVAKAGYTTDPVDGIIGSEDITIVVDYTFTNGTAEPDQNAPVTYNNTTAKVADSSAEVAKNYDITFEIADGTGKVTGGEVTGIAVKTPDKTAGYVHGDVIDLTGTEITITYDGNADKTDKYVYDATTEKWTYTKNGVEQPDKVELPSEIALTFTGGNAITPGSVVKYPDNGKTITATYTKDAVNMSASTEIPFEIDQKELAIVVTPPSTSEPVPEQEYSGSTALNAENLEKVKASVDTSAVVAIDGETINLVEGTFAADFATKDVAYDQDGNVIAQPITVKADAYSLDGADAGNYKLVIFNNMTGKVTPKAATVTVNSVPPIKEEETNLVVDITDITTEGLLPGDDVVITWKGTYDKTTATVDTTTTREVSGNDAGNYTVTFTPDSKQGSVTLKVVTGITIDNQPKYADETPKHGDTVGADGLDNLEYTVEYSDGSTTKHKKENGEWVTTDGYTEPEAGTKFTWNDTTEEVTENSVIRKDKDNTVTIAVEGKTATTDVVAAAAKPITITAVGTYTKVYDGTNAVTLNETTPEITYVIEGLAAGDVITVTATPAFADENVAKFGDIYQKAINFTNVVVTGDEAVLANYEIQKDENGNETSSIMGAITPKTMNITAITVPSKSKGASADVTVTKSKKFTTTDIIEKDKDTVTIGYEGTYSSTSKAGENIPVTVDASSVVIDGDDKAILNYVVGTVTGAIGEVTSGGGNTGGGGNSLTIKYELEDGKAGKSVTKLTAPAGSEPVDLIGVFASKLSDPTITWTSSDENIVKVDENGVVTFVGEGEATVTATSNKQKNLTDKVTVTVTKSLATPTPEPTRGPELITKTMLNPYIVGYGDNVFGPELPISREEVATIFARLIANDLYMDQEYTPSFFDVDLGGWSKNYIGYLEGYNVVSGYEDGSFKPKDYITRAEMAVLMAKAEGYNVYGYLDGEETGFNDIRDGYCEWATKSIKYLTEAGIMYGYEDGSFRPGQPITRAETVATINRVLSNQKVAEAKVLPSDVSLDHWAYDDIVFAMNHRVLKDVSADASVFIDSEEFDKNMVTITETVYDTTEENDDGDTTSPSETPAPTTAPEATPPTNEEDEE